MNTRHAIAAADPARALRPEAFELDVDALLDEFAAQSRPGAAQDAPRSTPHRRRRLDLALAAVVVAFLAAVALVPFSTPGVIGGRSTSTPTSRPTRAPGESSAAAGSAATALLDEITVPAGAKRVSTPPAQYLAQPRTGLACRGQASAEPRYWIVPNTALGTVATFLQAHRPASATRLPFNHDPDGGVSGAFTLYRPGAHSEVVIALAETPEGTGIRADADVFLGSTCAVGG